MSNNRSRWTVIVRVGEVGHVYLVRGWPYFSRNINDARRFSKKNALRLASTLGGSAEIIP